MSTMKSLLAATDFSDDARNAVQRAAMLAAEHHAQLTLLHVMNAPWLETLRQQLRVSEEAESKLVADAQRQLNDLAAEAAGPAGAMPTAQVRIGRVVDETLAASAQTDLLALGARGWNPLRDMLLGTTADRLLHKCKRPVLVVKRAPQQAYKRVLVPVDFSPYSIAALHMARRIAPRASIIINHAFDVPFEGKLWLAGVDEKTIQEYRIAARQEALNTIHSLIKETGCDAERCFSEVDRGDAAPLILAAETKTNADLIVMGKHGRSMIEETLLGSVTRHVLSDAKCDVLIIHEANESTRG